MQNIKAEIDGKPVDWYSDVFSIVFPDVDTEKANSLWKEQLKRKGSKEKKQRKKKDEDDESGDEDDDD